MQLSSPEIAVVLAVLRVGRHCQPASTQLGGQSTLWHAQLSRRGDATIAGPHRRHTNGALWAGRQLRVSCTRRAGQPGRQPAAPLPPAWWRRRLLLPCPPLWSVVGSRVAAGIRLNTLWLQQSLLLALPKARLAPRCCRICGGARAAQSESDCIACRQQHCRMCPCPKRWGPCQRPRPSSPAAPSASNSASRVASGAACIPIACTRRAKRRLGQ